MTPKKRRMISKSLLDLFEARAQEYQALVNERDETISQYDTGDDQVQRELHKEIGDTMIAAMNEIIRVGNYFIQPVNYCHKLLAFEDINLGNRVWSENSIIRRDNAYFWALLPTFHVSGAIRPLDVIDTTSTTEMYTNSSFNSADKGPGLDEPIVSTLVVNQSCGLDTTEKEDNRTFTKLYEAFTAMKNTFIVNGAFVASGIDFWSDSWPPHDVFGSDCYIPTLALSSYGKQTSSTYWSGSTSVYPYSAMIGNNIVAGTYVACSDINETAVGVAKVISVSEINHEANNEHGPAEYWYSYTLTVRPVTNINSTPVLVKKALSSFGCTKVFEALKAAYISYMNEYKAFIALSESNTTDNSLIQPIDNFIASLNTFDMSTVYNVELFYNMATTFNNLVNNRITTLLSIINSEDNLDDLKEMASIRVGKSNGTLFDIFRRMEGMDAQYIRYTKGSKKIDFLKKKMLVAKILEQPNNSYQVTIEKTVDSNYTNGENFRIGDTVYIVDNVRPELAVTIVDIKYGTIEDVDSDNIKSNDMSTAVKKVDVRFITTNRIISSDFDQTENLRIVKDL